MAVAIQAPDVKKNTKGRPSPKNNTSKSNKRNLSAFEVVQTALKKDESAKKREAKQSETNVQKSKRMKKTIHTFEESEVDDYNSSSESNISLPEANDKSASDIQISKDNKPIRAEGPNVTPVLEKKESDLQHKHSSEIPNHFQLWIKSIYDPVGDGNCGFHCVAKALGYDQEVETILDQLDLKPNKDNPDALEITRANWLS
ncbi:hypothetical protein PCASD_16037 [Puccinia coronata f. sp. avenae]|uniref:OTU domain-containing protein n=1 Tax=Puccinia coronata f. sp. avenae TaxID=200324 RepID=A0A2N5TZX2_9BASI|nr:hypothetical protein PCASD_16037 [Puccinia coronata f. sp. avenae]